MSATTGIRVAVFGRANHLGMPVTNFLYRAFGKCNGIVNLTAPIGHPHFAMWVIMHTVYKRQILRRFIRLKLHWYDLLWLLL